MPCATTIFAREDREGTSPRPAVAAANSTQGRAGQCRNRQHHTITKALTTTRTTGSCCARAIVIRTEDGGNRAIPHPIVRLVSNAASIATVTYGCGSSGAPGLGLAGTMVLLWDFEGGLGHSPARSAGDASVGEDVARQRPGPFRSRGRVDSRFLSTGRSQYSRPAASIATFGYAPSPVHGKAQSHVRD